MALLIEKTSLAFLIKHLLFDEYKKYYDKGQNEGSMRI